MDQGTCTFPGINQVVSATMSLTHGTSPSVCLMEIVPQGPLTSEFGTLAFQFGATQFHFPDCKIAEGTIRYNRNGKIWQLAIYDQRWKWRYGTISGHYNLHRDKDTVGALADSSQEAEIEAVLEWTKKTPVQLAILCLDAMNVDNYNCSALPDNIFPEVHWEDVVPAEALNRLCDLLGYIVVPSIGNQVVLYRRGDGNQLPDAPILSGGTTVDPPEGPDEIEIVCGPTLYQEDWELEAVGIDNDISNTLELIDDLAYTPTAGWVKEFPGLFANVSVDADRELAQKSVWRMYRLVTPPDVNGQPVDRRQQILPIGTKQVFLHLNNGTIQNVPAAAYGNYNHLYDDSENAANDTRYRLPFSINSNLGVVIFSNPVFNNLSAPVAATMTLRTAIPYRDKDTLAWDRYRHGKYTEAAQKKSFINRTKLCSVHDELQLYYNEGKPINLPQVKEACEHYIKAIENTFDTEYPTTATYPGLLAVPLDGAIANVTWHVGTGGATTTVSRNTEQYDYVKPYYFRRNEQRVAQMLKDGERFIRGGGLKPIGQAISNVWNWIHG